MKHFLGRVWRALPRFFAIVAGCMLALILGLLVFGEKPFRQVFRSGSRWTNGILLLCALGMLAVCMAGYWVWLRMRSHRENTLCHQSGPMPPRRVVCWLVAGHILLLAVQMVYVRSLWFYPGWDAGGCILTARELALGLPITHADYFLTCPNNVFLPMLLSIPMRIGIGLGLAEPYLLLPISSALFTNASALLGCLCAYKISKSAKVAGVCFLFSCVFIILSPYAIVPYSDPFAMLFPILALTIFLTQWKAPLKWFLITLCCAMGALIKATTMIVWVALVLVTLLRLPWGRALFSARGLRRAALILLAVVVGYAPNPLLQCAASQRLTGQAVSQVGLGMTH